MNILSSPIWPSDMPDERRVIALLGLVQISEEGMGWGWEDQQRQDELDAATNPLLAEIERLNALVAMQTEALKLALRQNQCDMILTGDECRNIESALSATAETVSAWQSKRDTEIRAKATIAIKRDLQAIQDDGSCLCASCAQYVERVAGHKIAELRAKGE